MASYVWPPSLPKTPLASGYAEEDGVVVRSVPMDSGPPQTLYESKSGERLSVSFTMSKTQLATLQTFLESTIRYTYPFDFVHPRTGQVVDIKLLPLSESSMVKRVQVDPDLWVVSMNFLVLP